MTLIEVLVAVTLIVVVLVPFGASFLTTVNAASANANRQVAASLATSVVSGLTATSYSNVGFTSTSLSAALAASPGYEASPYQFPITVTTQPSFKVGGSATTFAPIMTNVALTAGSHLTFTITTNIVYQSSYVTACPGYSGGATTQLTNAYAGAFVKVSWSNGDSGGGSVTQTTSIYPGGLTPYAGPQYSAAGTPAVPTNVTATGSVTGQINVGWSLPTGWSASAPTSCFAVGWSNTDQFTVGSGLLTNRAGWSSTASYTVTGLVPGGLYTAFVNAYSPNGVESVQSQDAPTYAAPSGPVVTAITPTSGLAGATITLTGTAFTKPTTQVQFCPSQNPCPSGTTSWLTANCSSVTLCTVPVPATVASTGVVTVIAETPTGPSGSEVTSPPAASDQFTYTPKVTGISPTGGSIAGGTTVTVTGSNLFQGIAFTFGSNPVLSAATCASTGISCTMTSPAGAAGTVDVVATQGLVSSATSAADKFRYT